MTRARTAALCIAVLVTPFGVVHPAAQNAAPAPAVAAVAQAPAQSTSSVFTTPAPGQSRRYGGAPTRVDFQGADLRWVLRMLQNIGGFNLVIDPSVSTTAKVDLTLNDVAWDEIFDMVCKTNQLKWEANGTPPLVRVLSSELAQKELEGKQRESDARAEAEAKAGIRSDSFHLNYAKGSEVEKILNSAGVLGKYAKAHFDERSNLLLITGLPEDIQFTGKLIQQLDQPEPQVEIAAQIVETDRDSARALGVQWGVNARMSPELGNTTGKGFPNNGSLSGRASDSGGKPATQGPNDPRASALSTTGSAVSLPVAGATSAIGLNLGSLVGGLNLDVALSALEHSGKGKVLSAPRVTTQNNVQAEVTQGFTIPFQAVSNNTVTVMFRDAALKLNVTPHVTGTNTVVMDVMLENGFPDFSRAVNGNPSISTQKATTKVLVADGLTTVIGGIVVDKSSNAVDKTPGVSRIPLIGLLFKRNSSTSSNQEIVIFITPRIIR